MVSKLKKSCKLLLATCSCTANTWSWKCVRQIHPQIQLSTCSWNLFLWLQEALFFSPHQPHHLYGHTELLLWWQLLIMPLGRRGRRRRRGVSDWKLHPSSPTWHHDRWQWRRRWLVCTYAPHLFKKANEALSSTISVHQTTPLFVVSACVLPPTEQALHYTNTSSSSTTRSQEKIEDWSKRCMEVVAWWVWNNGTSLLRVGKWAYP